MKALIYQSELEYISRCILDYPDIETGGDLFGFWTYSGFPVIQYVIGPGPNTYRASTFFKQDKEFLIENGKYLNEKHGLQHLGNWHSHHQLGLSQPSGHDSNTMAKAIKDNSLNQFFLVIGSICDSKTSINGFQYRLGQDTSYNPVSWVILDRESPIREAILKDRKYDLYYKPKKKRANIGKLSTTTLSDSIIYYEPIPEDATIWYSLKEGKEFIRNTLSDLKDMGFTPKMFKNETNQFIFHLNIVKISFPMDFPNKNPEYFKAENSEAVVTQKQIEEIINNNKQAAWTEQDT